MMIETKQYAILQTLVITLGSLVFLLPSAVQAVEEVRVVDDTSAPNVEAAATLKTIEKLAEVMRDIQDSLLLKERRDDPIQSQISAEAYQKNIAEAIKKINAGSGCDSTFVQNYGVYYSCVTDFVVSDFLFGDRLNDIEQDTLFEIRYSLVNEHLNAQDGNYRSTLPTEETARAEMNPLDVVFATFTNCTNDPICLRDQVKNDLERSKQNTLENVSQSLDHNQGFKPQRLVRNVANANGETERQSFIVTPPGSLAAASNYVFGEVPISAPLIADEYGETVSQYITELGNQTFSSPFGSLALGGNLEFSIDIFGEEGNLSYVDALINDKPNENLPELQNPTEAALVAEQEYMLMQNFIADTITGLENTLATSSEKFDSCFDLELTEELVGVATTTEANIEISSTTLTILTVFQSQWNSTSDPALRQAIINTFEEYKRDGYFRTRVDNFELQLKFIDLEFGEMVDNFKIDIDRELIKCGGDAIYNINEDEEEEDTQNNDKP